MEALETMFAPAERAAGETVHRQSEAVLRTANLEMLYDGVIDMVIILNQERQIVFANRNFLQALGLREHREAYGLRPGEALSCIHVARAPSGCGTAEFCRTCGAVRAILTAQKGIQDVQECRIMREEGGDALDLLVRTSPLRVRGEEFTIVAIRDISHEKRRRVLERIFFHDIMNTAVGLRALSEFVKLAGPEEMEKFRCMIYNGAARMVEDIESQRDLADAENNELKCYVEPIDSAVLLQEFARFSDSHEVARGRHIRVHEDAESVVLTSDRTLITRVLGNMIKNAFEASHEGETVTVGCRERDGSVEFWVHNPSFMPRDIQLQIFQRSFSTKGRGRGLGTYSMKLLGERYLKGRISFTSSEDQGTTFSAAFPLELTPVSPKGGQAEPPPPTSFKRLRVLGEKSARSKEP